MSDTLPKTGMTGDFNTTTAESGWGGAMNTNLRVTDTLMQTVVISRVVTAPPGSPADGDLYLVPTGGTGAWAGQDQRLAVWRADTAVWMFISPKNGWIIVSLADGLQQYRFDNTAWSLYVAPAEVTIQTADGSTVLAGITTLVVDNGTLTDEGGGVARLSLIESGVSAPNHQTVASYTPVLADGSRRTLMDLVTANSFLIPSDTDVTLDIGTKFEVSQFNVGITSLAPDSSVVLHLMPGKTLMCAGKFGKMSALKIASNEWLVDGDFAGASALVMNPQPNNYTLTQADGLDGRQCVENTDTAAHTLTIPPFSAVEQPIGQQIYGMASGAGSSWNIVGGAGVTIVSLGAVPAAPVASSVGLPFVMTQTAQDVWAVQGPIA